MWSLWWVCQEGIYDGSDSTVVKLHCTDRSLLWSGLWLRSSVVSWGGSSVSLQQSSNTDFLSMNPLQPSSKARFVSNHNMTRAAFPLTASLVILAAFWQWILSIFFVFCVNVLVLHTLKPVFLINTGGGKLHLSTNHVTQSLNSNHRDLSRSMQPTQYNPLTFITVNVHTDFWH